MRLMTVWLMTALLANTSVSGEDKAMLSGTVAGWQTEAAPVTAELFDGAVFQVVARGNIDAHGQLSLALPERLAPTYLQPLTSYLLCSALGADDASVAELGSLTVALPGGIFAVALASSENAVFPMLAQPGDYRVFFWYLERPLMVEAACEQSGVDWRYRLELKPGWNTVVETIARTGQREVRTVLTQPVPAGALWYALDTVQRP